MKPYNGESAMEVSERLREYDRYIGLIRDREPDCEPYDKDELEERGE